MKIFDTNIHPTLNEKWQHKDNHFIEIQRLNKKYNLKSCLAVGLNNVGNYNHKYFFDTYNKYDFIYPVAALNLGKNYEKEINNIYKIGFRFVKIHNRSNNILPHKIDFEKIFSLCNKKKLKILICTYFNCCPSLIPEVDMKYLISKSLNKFKNLKILFMHGGCERLMEYAELIRFNDNLLLDLSLTLTKYQGSSIDNDIKFLFNYFDRKITLGSDYPDVPYKMFFDRVKYFAKGVNKNKLENIFFKNAENFVKS